MKKSNDAPIDYLQRKQASIQRIIDMLTAPLKSKEAEYEIILHWIIAMDDTVIVDAHFSKESVEFALSSDSICEKDLQHYANQVIERTDKSVLACEFIDHIKTLRFCANSLAGQDLASHGEIKRYARKEQE